MQTQLPLSSFFLFSLFYILLLVSGPPAPIKPKPHNEVSGGSTSHAINSSVSQSLRLLGALCPNMKPMGFGAGAPTDFAHFPPMESRPPEGDKVTIKIATTVEGRGRRVTDAAPYEGDAARGRVDKPPLREKCRWACVRRPTCFFVSVLSYLPCSPTLTLRRCGTPRRCIFSTLARCRRDRGRCVRFSCRPSWAAFSRYRRRRRYR